MKFLYICAVALVLLAVLPTVMYAQTTTAPTGGIIQCGREPGDVCGWDDLLITIQRLLDFVLLYIAIPIATIVIIAGGFTMIFSLGSEAKFKKGRQMITGVAVGFVITFCAWLIVRTLIAIFFG